MSFHWGQSYDMIPVLQYVTTGTLSAFAKGSFLMNPHTAVPCHQLIGEKSPCMREVFTSGKSVKTSRPLLNGTNGPAIEPQSPS
ncbi:hypothetical protein CEXT_639871 [Caerostris extrusa]|uniref:Uncharacterized protein n=1 Tax=Caerostris extrusa TaxID=172846 RepID=A0AAV4Y025_CAEEX|nr:hypothetical protein CEXT_639871 [Caerostris extrusa]